MRSTSPPSAAASTIWNVYQPGPATCQPPPQLPFDTEMTLAGAPLPPQAARSPANTASAALRAARRTLAPIRYGIGRVRQRQDSHAALRRNRPDSMLPERSPVISPLASGRSEAVAFPRRSSVQAAARPLAR